MKITIQMTVEVDEERWAREYGIDVKEVREDVKAYVFGWAEQTPIPLKIISTNQKLRKH